MAWQQISLGEFVARAAGRPRFRAKHKPTQTDRRELPTDSSWPVGLFCLADETDAFILHNRFVGGDVWSPELSDYTDPVWETVVLRSTADAFTAIPAGPDSTHRIEWSGGSVQWNSVLVEPLTHLDQSVTLGVGGALIYTTSNHGRQHEFMVELELPSATGAWRLKQGSDPSAFTLTPSRLTPDPDTSRAVRAGAPASRLPQSAAPRPLAPTPRCR